VNGKLVVESIKISPTDKVEIDGEKLKQKKQPLYIACNKPKGVTSTTDPKDKTNIIYFLNHPKRIFPIGRLDKDSDGLIFLTNDGDIVNKILRAANNHEKEYVVIVNKAITPEFLRKMENGVPILDTVTKKCKIRQEGNKRFRIVLTQGLNRQIRRMCEALDYKVVGLTRTRIMNVTLSNIPVGKWRYLTPAEVDGLNKMVSSSSKTEEASIEERPKSARRERPAKAEK
jgi:23S rRNA pseudouridine2604 synthase